MPIYFPPGPTAVVRERITANRTYYVATTGSDSNDGLTLGAAFLTIQKAMDVAATIDFNGFTITVAIANGTYIGNITVPVTVGQKLPQNLLIQGNTSTPTSVVLAGTIGFTAMLLAAGGARCRVVGCQIAGNVGNVYGVEVQPGGIIEWGNCDFGSNLFIHLYANGGFLSVASGYTISGGGYAHYNAEAGGYLAMSNQTVTASGSPSFFGAFALVGYIGYMRSQGATFSGTVTGKRYDAGGNGVFNTGGGGASYFPGNAAGSTATGGLYL